MKYTKKSVGPLIRGKAARSNAGFQENISRERELGKTLKEAEAIAYGEANVPKGAKKEMSEYRKSMAADTCKMHKAIGK